MVIGIAATKTVSQRTVELTQLSNADILAHVLTFHKPSRKRRILLDTFNQAQLIEIVLNHDLGSNLITWDN